MQGNSHWGGRDKQHRRTDFGLGYADPQLDPLTAGDNPADQRGFGGEFISLADIYRFVRQCALLIAAFIAVGVLGAVLYLATTDRTFTANTRILIEPRIPQILQLQQGELNLSLDTAQVESQIAVMASEKLAKMVIDALELEKNTLFNQPPSPSFAKRLKRLQVLVLSKLGMGGEAQEPVDLAAPDKMTEFEQSRLTMAIFCDGLDIRRVGLSYAIDISFRSIDAKIASTVANALSDAYVREQIQNKAEEAKQGGDWLERRLKELRTQMNNATQTTQQFRARHDYSVNPNEGLSKDGATSDEVVPTLEELETTAETYRKMYESFLQAFTNSVSRQSYPVADARVITPATPPIWASNPKPKLVLALGLVAGLMVGIGITYIRHTLDRTVRSPRQIRDDIGIPCLGELPAVTGRKGGFARFDEVIKSPQSQFSESLRNVKISLTLADSEHPIRYLGVTSAFPGDGKSSCASNLAMLYAASGLRTLVIDADIFHSALTSKLLINSRDETSLEAEAAHRPVTQQIETVPTRGFDILPSSTSDQRHLLAPSNLQAVLPDLQCYDMVIVDLPPLISGADRLAIGSLLDGVIIVAEWGKTPVDLIAELTRVLIANKTPILGVLMTKVRIMSTRRYRRYEVQPPR
jgi:uncharacterized protein involved in exopolysaccharide biosynthesis/Mrp family chromosome partitioning ATPase